MFQSNYTMKKPNKNEAWGGKHYYSIVVALKWGGRHLIPKWWRSGSHFFPEPPCGSGMAPKCVPFHLKVSSFHPNSLIRLVEDSRWWNGGHPRSFPPFLPPTHPTLSLLKEGKGTFWNTRRGWTLGDGLQERVEFASAEVFWVELQGVLEWILFGSKSLMLGSSLHCKKAMWLPYAFCLSEGLATVSHSYVRHNICEPSS